MDKQQKLKIALPILFVVLAIVWGPIIFGSGTKNNTDKKHVNHNLKEDTGNTNLSTLHAGGMQTKTRTQYKEWESNPFMLKRTPKALSFEGVMWDEKAPKAIINGNIIGVGDIIENKTVIEIKPNSVIIKDNDGADFELTY